jgi:hypothetical protein
MIQSIANWWFATKGHEHWHRRTLAYTFGMGESTLRSQDLRGTSAEVDATVIDLNERVIDLSGRGQIKSRDRVRDLAEVYTHKREVDAILDLVADMFPSEADPGNTDRKFFEPACGHGNFLEEILRRKLAFVTTHRYGRGERFEHRLLRCAASIYAVDINEENVRESQARLRSVIKSHLDNELTTLIVAPEFSGAVERILATNIVCADTLAQAHEIELVDYKPGRSGTFTRQWSRLEEPELDLFSTWVAKADERPLHYSDLATNPGPVRVVLSLKARGR